MLVNGSLVLFVFSLIGYILFWYILTKNARNNEQKVWEKNSTDFEVIHEEPSIEELFYEEHLSADDSFLYKEECLMDESKEFDVYLDKDIAKHADWQNVFFGNTEHKE